MQELSARWFKARQSLLKDNQIYADRLIEILKEMYSNTKQIMTAQYNSMQSGCYRRSG